MRQCYPSRSAVATRAGLRISLQGAREQGEVVRSRDLDGAERFEVGSRPLHVEQRDARRAEALHERDESDLRGVGGSREHRLTCEQAANVDSVEAADEFAVGVRL